MQIVNSMDLGAADLIVDACYQGGRAGNAGDDPLTELIGVSNQGGFRYLGTKERPRLVALTTTLADPEWPDELDPETGIFTYFGDNKKPGRELHNTPRFGNQLLKSMFDAAHTARRSDVPVVLVFSNAGSWRDMIFRGIAVPGAVEISPLEDLVAVWKSTAGQRFQNYRAKFTILDVSRIHRKWLDDIRDGKDVAVNAPREWLKWVRTGKPDPLRAQRALEIRSKLEQLPSSEFDRRLLKRLFKFFADDPYLFESCAAEIVRMALGSVTTIDLTRRVRDGGRDAIGLFQIGAGASGVSVEFAMEAKCYSLDNSVGVKELSRLISRLRHRQFGVIVTTSWINGQAYQEIKDDKHPIVILSGGDIVQVLKSHGIATVQNLDGWLAANFSKEAASVEAADVDA